MNAALAALGAAAPLLTLVLAALTAWWAVPVDPAPPPSCCLRQAPSLARMSSRALPASAWPFISFIT